MILMAVGRKDGTEMFESHHPIHVKQILEKYYIGDVENFQEQFTLNSDFYQVVKERVEKYFQQSNVGHILLL